jgi:transmembrane protein TMEM260 (protein O-mannosyltransferase)
MTATPAEKPPYAWALATFAIVLLIYVATLAPTTAFWDASEYIAAARTLGIPHPPGNPLFVILAHTFGLLPLAADYAARINLFAATTSAGASAFWFLVAERWLRAVVPHRWLRYGAAFGGVLVGATSWTVWNQSVVNEKVYTVSLLSIAVVMYLVVRWGDDEPGPHRDRWLVLIAYVLALTATNHLMGFLALPALAIYVLWTDWRVATRPWAIVTFFFLLLAVSGEWLTMFKGDGASGPVLMVLTAGVLIYALWRTPRDPLVYLGILAVVVGISLNYIWLPMRAGQYPPINEGEPVGFFSQALQDVLNRVQYGKPSLFERQASFFGQLANFWQYFTWQFARDWGAFRGLATALFTVLGLSGLLSLWKRDRRAGLAAAALLGVLTVGLVFYMNFKYGYSQYPGQPSLPREVRERDYFFMGSFSAYGVFVALGLGTVLEWVVEFLGDRVPPARRWLAASPALLLALIPLLGNHGSASRAGETMARDFAYDILQSVEPYGILITAGDNDTFPLWYAQEVEGIRKDVTLANLSLMNTEWHLKQLRRRETPAFDPSRAADLWKKVTVPPRPTTPVLSLDYHEIDSLPEAMRTPGEGGIDVNGLHLQFGQDVLLRQDLATIFLIRDNLGKRPIFFSWSDGGYPDQTFGLSANLESFGFVRKLHPTPVQASDSVVLSPGLGYVNLPRTESLLWNTYHWKTAVRDRPHGWIDPPSGTILQLYSVIYGGAARVLESAGDSAQGARADSVAKAVSAELSQGDRL